MTTKQARMYAKTEYHLRFAKEHLRYAAATLTGGDVVSEMEEVQRRLDSLLASVRKGK